MHSHGIKTMPRSSTRSRPSVEQQDPDKTTMKREKCKRLENSMPETGQIHQQKIVQRIGAGGEGWHWKIEQRAIFGSPQSESAEWRLFFGKVCGVHLVDTSESIANKKC